MIYEKEIIYLHPDKRKDITEVKLHLDIVKNGLVSKLYEPVTPFDVSSDSNASYAEHMGRDIQALLECDAVYFCRGWQDSKGCQAEYEVAKIYGKQIVFE